MRLLTILLAAIALLLAGGNAADAHALLRQAQPAVGATVPAAPDELLLIFSESVEPDFSHVSVTDAQGTRVDTGTVHTDPENATHLLVGVHKLAPGKYTVSWHATSTDTHKTQGSYSFTVAP